jgi:hypothetical protein
MLDSLFLQTTAPSTGLQLDIWMVLLLTVVPMALALALVMLVLRRQLARDEITERYKIRQEAFGKLLPLKVTAYERTMLYLDRIHPTSLIARSDPNRGTATLLAQQFQMEIEVEYTHNVVQQLYISESAWRTVLAARNESVALVQAALQKVGANGGARQLVEAMLALGPERKSEAHATALAALKRDFTSLYGA